MKPATLVTILVTTETNAPFTNVLLAFNGHLAITPTNVLSIANLSHNPPLTPSHLPPVAPPDPLAISQFLLLPLAVLTHHILSPTDHITGTIPPFPTRTT